MTILDIVQYPAEVLRRPADEVTKIDGQLVGFLDQMLETMYAAPGVGLAAPQVGESIRVLVMDPGPDFELGPLRLINPRVTDAAGQITWEEGCLSIPGFFAEVERPESVAVEALDTDGNEIELELSGFPAVVVQHEIDHLDGKLFVDYLSRVRWRLFENEFGKDPWRWKYGQRQI